MQFKIKAGRFLFDKQTKKVKVSKQKGLIHVIRNQQQQTHFKWASLETNTQQLDIIVFPGDAIFESVVDKKNTFVLRFGMDDDRYFFWLQEKSNEQNTVKEINKLINYQQAVVQNVKMVDESTQKKEPIEKEVKRQQPQPKLQADFISKLTAGIAAATAKLQHKKHNEQILAITHLSDAINSQALNSVIKQFNQEQVKKLSEFLPEEHKDGNHLPSTLRSPQFLQALDALSDALNSQNALPLFMELGLKTEFLQKNYGVQAFLLALVQKFKKKQQ